MENLQFFYMRRLMFSYCLVGYFDTGRLFWKVLEFWNIKLTPLQWRASTLIFNDF